MQSKKTLDTSMSHSILENIWELMNLRLTDCTWSQETNDGSKCQGWHHLFVWNQRETPDHSMHR